MKMLNCVSKSPPISSDLLPSLLLGAHRPARSGRRRHQQQVFRFQHGGIALCVNRTSSSELLTFLPRPPRTRFAMLAPLTSATTSGGAPEPRGPRPSATCSACPNASRRTSSAKTYGSMSARRTSCCSSGRAAAASRRSFARSRRSSARPTRSRARCRTWLIDTLPGRVEDRLATLAAGGRPKARLLLRTPRS